MTSRVLFQKVIKRRKNKLFRRKKTTTPFESHQPAQIISSEDYQPVQIFSPEDYQPVKYFLMNVINHKKNYGRFE